ncbi:MAG: Bax inhibitor-1/YccA family protein, partial [Isosphaeraceae bacterium]
TFKPNLAPWTAPVYAALEGVFLGALSYLIEHSGIRGAYPGIALQAVSLTVGVLFVMLFLYGSRTIRVTQKLRTGIIAATGALCLVYLGSFLLTMFGVPVPFLRNGTPLGIGISLVVVGLAAFNLLLDFDFIENASASGMPKSMEWYGAFGLIVTLVWLYLELLRLLRQFADRR